MQESFSRIIEQGKVAPWWGDAVMHLLHRRSLTLKVSPKLTGQQLPQPQHCCGLHRDGSAALTSLKSPTTLPRWPVGRELSDNLTAPGATEARFSSTTTTPKDGLTPGEKVGSAGLRRCSGHCGMCSQEAN